MSQKIILIDDENDFTELTGTLLGFHDFDVDTFNDPREALEAILSHHYDLIVTDLMMPHMDGFELVDKIISENNNSQIPIIVLSAKVLNDDERKKLFQDNIYLMTKPFEPETLVQKIQELTS